MRGKFYVDESSIHGRGLFARKRIERGERIGKYRGRKTDTDGTYVLWIEGKNETYHGIDGTTDLRFVNHSAKPNAEFVDDLLVAVRVIRPGDEITAHYGEEWESKYCPS
jgi:uncharacterized protein